MISSCRSFLSRRVFCAVAPAALLSGQSVATVFGRIRFRNGQPAVGFTVAAGSRFNYTDLDGNYRILNVPYGQYTMEIRQGSRSIRKVALKVAAPRVQHDEIL